MATLAGTKIISIPEKHFYAIGKKIHHGGLKDFKKEVKALVKREGGIPKSPSQKERKNTGLMVKTCFGDGRFVNIKLN